MRCLNCGKELTLLTRLTGSGDYCSESHKQSYQEVDNRIAFSRLLQAHSPGVESSPVPEPAEPRRPEAPPDSGLVFESLDHDREVASSEAGMPVFADFTTPNFAVDGRLSPNPPRGLATCGLVPFPVDALPLPAPVPWDDERVPAFESAPVFEQSIRLREIAGEFEPEPTRRNGAHSGGDLIVDIDTLKRAFAPRRNRRPAIASALEPVVAISRS